MKQRTSVEPACLRKCFEFILQDSALMQVICLQVPAPHLHQCVSAALTQEIIKFHLEKKMRPNNIKQSLVVFKRNHISV